MKHRVANSLLKAGFLEAGDSGGEGIFAGWYVVAERTRSPALE